MQAELLMAYLAGAEGGSRGLCSAMKDEWSVRRHSHDWKISTACETKASIQGKWKESTHLGTHAAA
jgi:hypothetical protein